MKLGGVRRRWGRENNMIKIDYENISFMYRS